MVLLINMFAALATGGAVVARTVPGQKKIKNRHVSLRRSSCGSMGFISLSLSSCICVQILDFAWGVQLN